MKRVDVTEVVEDRRLVRSETFARIRWIAVAGQLITILIVQFGLHYPLPLWSCLCVIAFSIVSNLALQIPTGRWLTENTATVVLVFDALQFAALIFLTGGISNPFYIMSVGPVMIAASILPGRKSVIIGGLVAFLSTLMIWFSYPLPWRQGQTLDLPFLYTLAIYIAILVSISFVGYYVSRVAQEGKQLAQALTATELVLSREHHLTQLDGLAAAAAHELGTPLGTIALIAKELSKSVPEDKTEIREDLKILRDQVDRCRNILLKLTTLKDQQQDFFECVSLRQLLSEVSENLHNSNIKINIISKGNDFEPACQRNTGLSYGITNLLENALDYASSSVVITAEWDNQKVNIEIKDDGTGYAPEVLYTIGKPYISKRKRDQEGKAHQGGGLGLGLFIAKTLLERTGAQLSFSNAASPDKGAIVRITWDRPAFETCPIPSEKILDSLKM